MENNLIANSIPFFGARKVATALFLETQNLKNEVQVLRESLWKLEKDSIVEIESFKADRDSIKAQLDGFKGLSVIQIEAKQADLEREISHKNSQFELRREELEREIAAEYARLEGKKLQMEKEFSDQTLLIKKNQSEAEDNLQELNAKINEMHEMIVATEDVVLLQEAGVYQYRHPLTNAVAYQLELLNIDDHIKNMVRKDGGAVLATTSWTVNGSIVQGRTMVRDFSKLLLRAFNAEADNLVRGLKPYKLDSAIEKIMKVAGAIERLGKTMDIRIADEYLRVRIREMELTSDFLQKEAEEKAVERAERERLREERKVHEEIERERVRLEKEYQHYSNALLALESKGDVAAADRIRTQLVDVQRAIEDVDYRAANIRAGYVYVISNLGSFGESIVKVGMTRRLDPLDRIRELSDASVPFNFDVHALFFSKDAVGIEAAMHERLADVRVNLVNRRREFFRTTPLIAKGHLAELAGELLQFHDIPEALEYRESLSRMEIGKVESAISI